MTDAETKTEAETEKEREDIHTNTDDNTIFRRPDRASAGACPQHASRGQDRALRVVLSRLFESIPAVPFVWESGSADSES